jgi:hypothetical protein
MDFGAEAKVGLGAEAAEVGLGAAVDERWCLFFLAEKPQIPRRAKKWHREGKRNMDISSLRRKCVTN